MKQPMHVFALAVTLVATGCREKVTEVEISETRELTSKDEVTPKLMATSEERFEGGRAVQTPTGGESVSADAPAGWTKVAGSSMRLINFSFGPDAEGEVYLSKSRGDVPANAIRWVRQFGSEATSEAVSAMPKARLGSLEGTLVEARGVYNPGMGRPEKDGQALLGIIAESDGAIWTLKMTGPEALVSGQRETFLGFARSLSLPE